VAIHLATFHRRFRTRYIRIDGRGFKHCAVPLFGVSPSIFFILLIELPINLEMRLPRLITVPTVVSN